MAIEIKNGYAHYECGCKFKVIETGPPVRLDIDEILMDQSKLPLTCSRTWDLLSEGNTKGVFQLETRFGQQYAKKLQPDNIEHLAALSALLRPGCLNNIIEGKSVTEHYIDRKHGREEIDYFHPDLENVLGNTYGLLVYQEQAMEIAQHFAGFNLQQADVLRKAIGKKKADIMATVKKEFMEGCAKIGILTQEQAEELFSWIEKSQRYSFNKSHAVSYAINSYLSAYLKAHFPVSFFTSYLYFAKDKQGPLDEVKALVSNAKLMDIQIYPPDFRNANVHFQRMSTQPPESNTYNPWNDKIHFGFLDIRGIGSSAINKINTAIFKAETALEKSRDQWTWIDFLLFFATEINSTAVNGLIESGALDYFHVSRTKMLFEYEEYCKLTKKEQAWIVQNMYNCHDNLKDMLEQAIFLQENDQGKCFANKNRLQKAKGILKLISNPPRSLNDTPDWVASVEGAKLGVSLTASALDSCKNISQANCTLIDFVKHKENSSGMFMACEIEEIKSHMPRNRDREMAFITVKDGDCSLDCVAFFDEWEKIKTSGVCFQDNKVLITGERARNSENFVIKNMWQLT